MRAATALTAFLLSACSATHTGGEDGGGTDPGDYDDCRVPSDCVLRPASCCGACGAATREDSVALNADRAADYQGSVCGDDVGCPACFMEQDPTLIATCEAGRCVVVDLLAHPATECAADADCRLRAGECCECGASVSATNVLSVADPGAIEDLLCDPGFGCPECAPIYPDSVTAACESGRCVVASTDGP